MERMLRHKSPKTDSNESGIKATRTLPYLTNHRPCHEFVHLKPKSSPNIFHIKHASVSINKVGKKEEIHCTHRTKPAVQVQHLETRQFSPLLRDFLKRRNLTMKLTSTTRPFAQFSLGTAAGAHFVLQMQNFALRLPPKISPNIAPARKSDIPTSLQLHQM